MGDELAFHERQRYASTRLGGAAEAGAIAFGIFVVGFFGVAAIRNPVRFVNSIGLVLLILLPTIGFVVFAVWFVSRVTMEIRVTGKELRVRTSPGGTTAFQMSDLAEVKIARPRWLERARPRTGLSHYRHRGEDVFNLSASYFVRAVFGDRIVWIGTEEPEKLLWALKPRERR